MRALKGVDHAHEFALFSEQSVPADAKAGDYFMVLQPDLVRRLTQVLRVSIGQSVILFDSVNHMRCIVEAITSSKAITLRLLSIERSEPLRPRIHWLLPLLDRDAWEAALASLAGLGATSVQPLLTQKVHRRAFTAKESDRLDRVMVAAAEVAKQFVLPDIKPLLSFEELQLSGSGPRLFFDPQGESALGVFSALCQSGAGDIICMVGPEGDLTPNEKSRLKQLSFTFVALTPTILRSKDAVSLATGLIRSLC